MTTTSPAQIVVDYGRVQRPLSAYLPTWIPDNWVDQLFFWRYHRRFAHLNPPHTWNEKMLWLKQHHRPPVMRHFADKRACRAWIAEQIGEQHCVPLLGCWDRTDQVPWHDLPHQFVLKAAHGSGWTIICRDRTRFDAAYARRLLDGWLAEDFGRYAREWHYRGAAPSILLEPMLCEADGTPARDVKVTCIHGIPRIISVHIERYSGDYRLINLDADWNDLGFRWKVARAEQKPPRPAQLTQLLTVAQTLAAGLPHARIDCFLTEQQVRVGEITIFGERGINTVPDHIDRWIGDLLDLPTTETC